MESNENTHLQGEDTLFFLPENTLLQGGKYKIVRFIAHGGFGCTYEAVNTTWRNRRVAIKELFVSDFCCRDNINGSVTVSMPSKKPLFNKLRDKFLGEADRLNGLIHPGIVRVTDAFEENGTAYYVMDYIDGYSIRDLVRNHGAQSEVVALRYIRQVADALQYVHAHNLLHLDIKPDNIMITGAELNAVLIDFGVSKQYDEASGENTSSLMGYSLGFAPVEQMNIGVSNFQPATDIYALGATFYMLLTGIAPPPANKLAAGEAELLPLPDHISASTRRAVLSAMNIRKNERPQSIADFLNILDDTPQQQIRQEPQQATQSQPKRVSQSAIIGAIVGILLCVVAVVGAMRGCEDNQTERIVQEETTILESGKEQTDVYLRKNERPQSIADFLNILDDDVSSNASDNSTCFIDDDTPQQQIRQEPQQIRQEPQQKRQSQPKRVSDVYQVGDYYNENGIEGVVFEVSDDGCHGKVVSMDETRDRWCTVAQDKKEIIVGASSTTDGEYNTDMIAAQGLCNYPAAEWCRDKGSQWYLPAKEELLAISRNIDKINNTLSQNGGTEITTESRCWSSTEYDKICARGVRMGDGDTILHSKINFYYYVRAVSAF